MGRTFKSIRMGSQEVAQRWLKASRALSKEDQIYGQMLAEMVKMHSSEAFYATEDKLFENFQMTVHYKLLEKPGQQKISQLIKVIIVYKNFHILIFRNLHKNVYILKTKKRVA